MTVLDVFLKAMLPTLLGKRHVPYGEKPSLKSGCWRFGLLSLSESVINADCCTQFSSECLAFSSTALSQPMLASLKGTEGRTNV